MYNKELIEESVWELFDATSQIHRECMSNTELNLSKNYFIEGFFGGGKNHVSNEPG